MTESDRIDKAYRNGAPEMTDESYDAKVASGALIAPPSTLKKIDHWPADWKFAQLKYDGVHVVAKIVNGRICTVHTNAGGKDVTAAATRSPAFQDRLLTPDGELHGEAFYYKGTHPDKSNGSRRALAAAHLLNDVQASSALAFMPWGDRNLVPTVVAEWLTADPAQTIEWLIHCHYIRAPIDGVVFGMADGSRVAFKGPAFKALEARYWIASGKETL